MPKPIPGELALYLVLFSMALGVILPIVFGWTKRKKEKPLKSMTQGRE